MSREKTVILAAGGLTGLAALLLTALGNPENMGFCVACFLRDTTGALGFHGAEKVQYLRPEILGMILGAFVMAKAHREFRPQAGSAPAVRFILGIIVMIGALAFLGCPLRLALRLAGGDGTALAGLAGMIFGVLAGVTALNRGFSLGRAYPTKRAEGYVLPGFAGTLLLVLLAVPALLNFSKSGPGASHAPLFISLAAGLLVGALAQRSRLCMAGGFRDIFLFRDFHLFYGFCAVFAVALAGNLLTGQFQPLLAVQPIAHHDYLWSGMGMAVVGWGSVLLGGCPLRQLILAGSGNGDSTAAVFGMIFGAAIAHNFGLAGVPDTLTDGAFTAGGVPAAGRMAILLCFGALMLISVWNRYKEEKHD